MTEIREYKGWNNLNIKFKCSQCEIVLHFFIQKDYSTGIQIITLICDKCQIKMYLWCGSIPEQKYIGELDKWLKRKQIKRNKK